MNDPHFTLTNARIAILGLGLMGGSLAMALKGQCLEIAGADTDPRALSFALEQGIIQRTTDLQNAVTANIVVLATPARAILQQVQALASITPSHPVTLIDLGSTKARIVEAMCRLPPAYQPLGGHPMCGKEASGIANADRLLFRGALFALTPFERTTPTALGFARELVSVVGAHPLELNAQAHDQLVSHISHLPYVVSAALMRAALAAEAPALWALAASGFRDTTRLAASDLTMMTDILLTNREAVLDSVRAFRLELTALERAIESADEHAIRTAFTAARQKRQTLFQSGS